MCEDDCSRKVVSEWSERKKSIDILDVLEDYILENGKPEKVMHDNGKQFTSTKIFRRFLQRNNIIKDKSIPATRYPQLQGKIEAYNKIVKNEFLAVENILNIEDGEGECIACLLKHTMKKENMVVLMVTHHLKCSFLKED